MTRQRLNRIHDVLRRERALAELRRYRQATADELRGAPEHKPGTPWCADRERALAALDRAIAQADVGTLAIANETKEDTRGA